MIKSYKDYRVFLAADAISMGLNYNSSFDMIKAHFINPRWRFIKKLRTVELYKNSPGIIAKMLYAVHFYNLKVLGLKLGFSIPPNVCGKGLSLPHYGTLVISKKAVIGDYARIHICVNIGESGEGAPQIGNNVYIGPGAKLFGPIKIGDNVQVGANAVVNKSFFDNNIVLAGVPAKIVKILKSENGI